MHLHGALGFHCPSWRANTGRALYPWHLSGAWHQHKAGRDVTVWKGGEASVLVLGSWLVSALWRWSHQEAGSLAAQISPLPLLFLLTRA